MSVNTSVTVVVPTRNESENVVEFLKRLPDVVTRVIFVDDSDDDTPQEVDRSRHLIEPIRIDLVHRPPGHRSGGLAGAVTRGFGEVNEGWICVIDGDLQHPPEVIASLVERTSRGDVDLVVACRSGDEAWEAMSPTRRVLSALAGRAARLAFRRLPTADPMSGFFVVSHERLDITRLRADGFKILLEVLVTHPEFRVAEVPYVFAKRSSGSSKGNIHEGLRYGRHLLGLRLRSAPFATKLRRSR